MFVAVASAVAQPGSDVTQDIEVAGLEDLTPVRDFIAAAALSKIAIYTVDRSANVNSASRVTLQNFASLTGGRWYTSGNAEQALAGALADSQSSYPLAYYSPIREKDRGQLALQFAFYNQGFLKEAWAPIAIDVNLTQDQFDKAQKDWLDISQNVDFQVSGEIQEIRVMVFDRRLYALGPATVSPLK